MAEAGEQEGVWQGAEERVEGAQMGAREVTGLSVAGGSVVEAREHVGGVAGRQGECLERQEQSMGPQWGRGVGGQKGKGSVLNEDLLKAVTGDNTSGWACNQQWFLSGTARHAYISILTDIFLLRLFIYIVVDYYIYCYKIIIHTRNWQDMHVLRVLYQVVPLEPQHDNI